MPAEPPAQKVAGICPLKPARVRPVGSVPAGASPYGCLDMAGNAWEWVQGFYQGNPQQRILRGGAVGYGERSCRTYARSVEGSGAT
jgi:formylglycine-generating enzyme required for sulfatase activity